MKNIFLITCAVLLFVSCKQQSAKTGFVNNTKVVSDYKEMKTAQEKWTKANNDVRLELQEKARKLQIEIEGYKNVMGSMSSSNRTKKEKELMQKQQAFQQEQQARSQEIQKGSQDEIDSIIKKVKNYIADYGKKNGYTYIYGDTEASNILYGKEDLDLTEAILKEINGDDYKESNTTIEKEVIEDTLKTK